MEILIKLVSKESGHVLSLALFGVTNNILYTLADGNSNVRVYEKSSKDLYVQNLTSVFIFILAHSDFMRIKKCINAVFNTQKSRGLPSNNVLIHISE